MENTKKGSIIQNRTNREYHVKYNKDIEHQELKLYCDTNHFNESKFLGTHNKPPGVCGLGNHYHMCFDTKLGHITY